MKKYVILLGLCLSMCLSTMHMNMAYADTASFQEQLAEIEGRTELLNLVIKKLTSTFKKAKKQHEFLVKSGMSDEDIASLESAFQRKIKKMINDTVKQINEI